MVWHLSGEIYYLTRADVTWMIGGVSVTDPTPAQLAQLKPGDCAILVPPRSKTDQFGEIHCPFPSTEHGPMDDLLYAALLYCFGRAAAETHSWHSLRSGLA